MEDFKRKYEEALETARKINSGEGVAAPKSWTMLEVIFPELVESKDEKIRESLVEIFKLVKEKKKPVVNEENANLILTWLEKQGKQSNNEEAEKEKNDYVSNQFLYCKGSFNEFKEGESYWLEYIGNDNYIGRSDNILNQKFHITPRQLYTWLDPRHDYRHREDSNDENNAPREYGKSEDEKIRKSLLDFLESVWHLGKNAPFEKWDKSDCSEWMFWLEKQKSIREIVERCKKSWYNEGKIAGMAEGLTDDEKYQQGWHDALEKQGEKKPVNNEPKFKVGDWITDGDINLFQIIKIDNEWYYADDGDRVCFDVAHDYYHLWSIEDAKDGDVLDANGAPFIYKKHDKDYVYFYCGVNLADAFIEATENDIWDRTIKIYPAIKDQRDLLFSKMEEAGYKWDDEKKEIVAIKLTPKFKVGDYVVLYPSEIKVNRKVVQISRVERCQLNMYWTTEGTWFGDGTDARLWTIQDAKDGDVLAAHECYVLFKEIVWLNIKCYCTYYYTGFHPSFHIDTLHNKDAFHPATKEECDLFFQKIKEEGYEWNVDKLELKKIEQKPGERISVSEELYEHIRNAHACMEDANCSDEELKPKWKQDRYDQAREDLEEAMKLISVEQKSTKWSEEDEKILSLMQIIVRDSDVSAKKANELSDWLKSLKEKVQPQNTWKPSNEQIEVLLSEVTGWKKGCPKQIVLESLYNDLKKLK